ncbi:MAG TPA: hypothetical protein VEJ47_10755 [Candidatus Eremiobacteraceae bacterium]|nr:hypothetical protein [Candidatus Eremiobacteraceae bacterium]
MRILAPFFALLMAVLALPATAQTGVWLPVQVPVNGLGTWWELLADGSATRNRGVFAEARYSFDGTFLTVIPGGDRKDRPRFRLRFDGDRMYSRADQAGAPEAEYRRVGPASPYSPLIGQWASVAAPSAGKSAMPGMTAPPPICPQSARLLRTASTKCALSTTPERVIGTPSARPLKLTVNPSSTSSSRKPT